MPYASCLASCSVVWWWSCNSSVLLVLRYFLLNAAQLFWGFGVLQPLLFRVFHITPWDSLYGLCASWDSLSSFPSLWLVRCTLGQPVWPVVGYPFLGVHPSITIVTLIIIGYHCNCLDGQLNCQASARWLIDVPNLHRMYGRWLCPSTIYL